MQRFAIVTKTNNLYYIMILGENPTKAQGWNETKNVKKDKSKANKK